MATLTDLLAKQTQLMGCVQRALTNFKKLGQAKMTKAVTQQRLENVQANYVKCQEVDAQICVLADDKTKASLPYFTENQFLICEEAFFETSDFMAEIIAAAVAGPASAGATPAAEESIRSSSHLPKMRLPTFNGHFDQWEAFRDKFRSLIIRDKTLSNVDRMHYLSSCLTGEASDALDHLAVTDTNFAVAWQLLTAQYENKRRLITTHIHALNNLPIVTRETASEIRELRNKTFSAIQALKNLGRPVGEWDDMLVYLVTERLDTDTRKAWELELGNSCEYPSFKELTQFLDSRIRALESIPETSSTTPKPHISSCAKPEKFRAISSHSAAIKSSCPVCRSNHLIIQCDVFKNQPPSQRYNTIRNLKRCINCFSAKHTVKDCASEHACKQCRKRHHTMLHFASKDANPPAHDQTSSSSNNGINAPISTHLASKSAASNSQVLLATARVRLYSATGQHIIARALLDQGSAATLITENMVQMLRLPKLRRSVQISGVGNTESTVHHAVDITISPVASHMPTFGTTALVLKTLTRYVPQRAGISPNWPHVKNLTLADDDPMGSDPINILIGADLYGSLLLDGIRKGADDQPIAQNTALGWILSGPTKFHISSSALQTHHVSTLESLDHDLRRFWEVEDLTDENSLSQEEQFTEQHFVTTHRRSEDGRYILRLPFKPSGATLGESKYAARARLLQVERRLNRDSDQYSAYRSFLEEYLELNHMEPVNPTHTPITQSKYYIPHHAVFKGDSSTTPLRVVFNASCRTSTGLSLNNLLCVGPKLQTELSAILIRWRQHRYVYTADSEKMYRQILVDPRDRDYQRILWRFQSNEPINEYRLCTVTYGTASAAFQAQRVLQQLAEDEGAAFPLATPILRDQVYVDDFIFGADDRPLATRAREQLTALLHKGGFRLRKWASNCPSLLFGINASDHGLASDKPFRGDDQLKVLGVSWNPASDTLKFRVNELLKGQTTKRSVMSTIARLFDPLGLVSPVVVKAKILLQKLWLAKCEWDEPLPVDLQLDWQKYYASLPSLNDVSIPRWTHHSADTMQYSLHGFADASMHAYAAVVYSRVMSIDGVVSISLLMAKTKVAPVKAMTIPRLELSAALLLARLMTSVRAALARPHTECYCWTDSTITLAWIGKSPSQWQTFVANRVAAIQNLLPEITWQHVPTQENPADCASRGLDGAEILSHQLWWRGPAWLRLPKTQWPVQPPILASETSLEKRKHTPIYTGTTTVDRPCPIASRFSSWPKLLRVTAYMLRFATKLRRRVNKTPPHDASRLEAIAIGAIEPPEIHAAKNIWLRKMQRDSFAAEIDSLTKEHRVAKSSPISSLNAFIDSEGLLRVGGRLRKSNLPEKVKHPVLLRSHPILPLIISHHHLRTLHGGSSLTLTSLRDEYWILRARTTVRAVLHRCVVCARENALVPTELMGELPAIRTTRTARAFVHTGVDYAGPILVRNAAGRGHKSHKAYIALFICMTTKAVHIELVHDYGSTAFIAAFQRFASRRGLPTHMYSDNGTTFRGADRELTATHRQAVRDPETLNALATDAVTWHFIPPAAPHFGGLWETGVRSVKYHLKRCIGRHTLTAEELTTTLCRIEACLNSRPIAAVSENLDDYQALTPGHLLIGAPLTAAPEPSVLELNEHRLSRWQLVQRITELFWRSWRTNYLHTLQQRPKWRSAQRLAKIGQIVLLRQDQAPPCQWELGRIIACHPGDDGLTRIVTVQTSRSSYTRPLSKICFLPVDLNQDEEREGVKAGGATN